MSIMSIGDDSDLLFSGDDEELGDDDLGLDGDDLGDDLFLGGPPAKPKQPRGRKIRRVKHFQPGHQTQVLPFPRGEAGATTVAAGALATVFARPQRTFQTQRFTWASTTSPFFSINQLTVGVDNMFVQAGVIPAEIFSQTGVSVSLRGYIARPGIDITMQCTNNAATAKPIEASIIGGTLL